MQRMAVRAPATNGLELVVSADIIRSELIKAGANVPIDQKNMVANARWLESIERDVSESLFVCRLCKLSANDTRKSCPYCGLDRFASEEPVRLASYVDTALGLIDAAKVDDDCFGAECVRIGINEITGSIERRLVAYALITKAFAVAIADCDTCGNPSDTRLTACPYCYQAFADDEPQAEAKAEAPSHNATKPTKRTAAKKPAKKVTK